MRRSLTGVSSKGDGANPHQAESPRIKQTAKTNRIFLQYEYTIPSTKRKDFIREVSRLISANSGLLSGEHGKGVPLTLPSAILKGTSICGVRYPRTKRIDCYPISKVILLLPCSVWCLSSAAVVPAAAVVVPAAALLFLFKALILPIPVVLK